MTSKAKTIRLGSRGSPLALRQTEMVRQALLAADGSLNIETVIIKTSGDWKPKEGENRLAEAMGGKGLFAKELQEALLARTIDAAVHSMKDMDSRLPEGLCIPCTLPREDVRDMIFINDLAKNNQKNISPLWGLKEGAVVGTASVRRQAFLLHRRPDLTVVPLRGNVGTRLEKLAENQVDATLLAAAGLRRLGMLDVVARGQVLSIDEMVPCAGQGAVGVEMLAERTTELAIFGYINCARTLRCVTAERAALAALDGSCRSPIGALAQYTGKGPELAFHLCVASLDGKHAFQERATGSIETIEEAQGFGYMIANKLRKYLPLGFNF
mgnify:CR=1 FL=1